MVGPTQTLSLRFQPGAAPMPVHVAGAQAAVTLLSLDSGSSPEAGVGR